ncbi:AtpZ/AtpI family protein [Acholeplasma vituli]|uniref:AtpZ/AtpI family protein n=1 Tax=Paracholeplasma vituli TaxID=69473 RepID=A0ABT2PU53_9MOLU|nr:AtpZ/AtpI family protein [Paracholeplasma vituli]MCU0104466.1 AtpZ/AtpI family protein [Paracholeplasma vituli]
MEPKKERQRKSLAGFIKEYNIVISFFYELVFVLLGLIVLGVVLDNYLNTKVLFTILFTLFGIYSSISTLYKRMKNKR